VAGGVLSEFVRRLCLQPEGDEVPHIIPVQPDLIQVGAGEDGLVDAGGDGGRGRGGLRHHGGGGQGEGGGGLRRDRRRHHGALTQTRPAQGGGDHRALHQGNISRVHKLQLGRPPDDFYGQFGVVNPRQLHDDAAAALNLDDGLGQAQAVDPVLHNLTGGLHAHPVHFLALGDVGDQGDFQAAAQVQAVADGDFPRPLRLPGQQVLQPCRVVYVQVHVDGQDGQKSDDNQQNLVSSLHKSGPFRLRVSSRRLLFVAAAKPPQRKVFSEW